ncbi:hypothetical protein ACWGBH_30250 [Streptomyces massasporeus]
MTDTHELSGHAARHRPWPLCRHCCGIALDMDSARTRVRLAGDGTVVDVPRPLRPHRPAPGRHPAPHENSPVRR